jgi:hypothetical protein
MNRFLARLDEQQGRWYDALESMKVGHGGDALLSRITGLHVDTVRRGRAELADDLHGRPADRVRLPGGGRPPLKKNDPALTAALLELVAPHTGGDPMSTAKYTRRSLLHLAADLAARGHGACPSTVAALLREHDYAPHVNVKRFTGPPHPQRDAQFRYIGEWVQCGADCGLPVLGVDTKKKELIGDFANAGAAWSPAGEEVNAHDFRQDARCRAVPYGLYDLGANRGHVAVGTSAATPAFAVDVIAGWWARSGRRLYPDAPMVVLLADAGGSNSCRGRLWKWCLQERLADRYGLAVTGCRIPPKQARDLETGTGKLFRLAWNLLGAWGWSYFLARRILRVI